MAKFKIIGGNKLNGEVVNQTSKNATLPIMAASLLTDGIVRINNVPYITDVENMVNLLQKLGVEAKREESNIFINPLNLKTTKLDKQLSKTMRSSIFLLGPLLAKQQHARITMPGGCNIGTRPIDMHINALKKLGVKVKFEADDIIFDATKVKAKTIKLKFPSVGATENLIQFCCKLKGKTTILNCAREPEVVDLCNFLNKMGAKIIGAGTSKITIFGVDCLKSTEYQPMGDRIVAGTIMCAVALCGGNVTMFNAVPYQNLKLIKILRSMGCQIDYKNDIIHIIKDKPLQTIEKISTGCYPKFPTDLQSIMLVVSCLATGKTRITENVFENRFLIVPELIKMGADIRQLNKKTVEVNGVQNLKGTEVNALDLRGGASLVLAGLCAEGETIVNNVNFIDRGYQEFEKVLQKLGASVKRE